MPPPASAQDLQADGFTFPLGRAPDIFLQLSNTRRGWVTQRSAYSDSQCASKARRGLFKSLNLLDPYLGIGFAYRLMYAGLPPRRERSDGSAVRCQLGCTRSPCLGHSGQDALPRASRGRLCSERGHDPGGGATRVGCVRGQRPSRFGSCARRSSRSRIRSAGYLSSSPAALASVGRARTLTVAADIGVLCGGLSRRVTRGLPPSAHRPNVRDRY
jgi:hypothetical protein